MMARNIFILVMVLLWTLPAYAQEEVNVRAGVHPSYTRIVFDWPNVPQYQVQKEGDALTVAFQSPARMDLADILKRDLPNISDAAILSSDANSITVSITIPPGSRFRDFSTDGRVILDIYNPDGEQNLAAIKTDTQPVEPEKTEPAPEVQEQPAPQIDVPSAELPVAEEKQTEEPQQTVDSEILALPEIDAHSILLSATKSFGMSVFQRENWLWLVLDDPTVNIPPQLDGPNKDKFEEFQKYEVTGGIAYRIRLPENFYVYAKGGGLTWDIVVTPYQSQSRNPIGLEREFDDSDLIRGASLVWPSDQTRKVLEFKDPSIGDTIQVVTTDFSDVYSGEAREFVELSKLNSAVGLALIPKVDDIEISRLSDRVMITRPGGLALTRPKDFRALELNQQVDAVIPNPYLEEAQNLPPMTRIYNFAAWEMGGLQALDENQTLLMAGIPNKNQNGQVTDLITLAKLNIANRKSQEALGFLRVAEDMFPDIEKSPEYLALRGAASTMAGRHDDALTDLFREELEPFEEVNYWKAYALAHVEDWQQAFQVMPKRSDVLKEYPDQIRIPATLAMTEVLLRGGEPEMADALLNEMGELLEDQQNPENAAWRYLQGEMERQKGNVGDAIDIWTELISDKDDLYRVKSSLALTRLEQEQERLDTDGVIDRLEALRYAWRGDQLETLINYRLAMAYVDKGDFLKGLTLMRNAATFTPGTKISEEITQKLTQIFRDIFANDVIANISPLDAISLYDEFKELTPPGPEGDIVTLKLAERLASADLLGRATELLQTQVTRRLSGEEKVKTAIRLAGIQLLDDKPNGTMRTLDLAEAELERITNISSALRSEYDTEVSLLRARALSDLGKTGAALTLLSGLSGDKNVMSLKADLAWKDGRWGDAADFIQDLIYNEDIALNRPINEYQAELILSRAIALNL
ncbi:MAG: hypothetical protein AAF569_08610, partial [Pseudomonadota bacterium]